MRVLFDGVVPVAYGQTYVTSRELPDMSRAFAGQANGLCGAGEPGALFLMTGTHSGRVHFTIELHDDEPATAVQEWEEIVEVSFLPRDAVVGLVPWGDGTLARLPLTPEGQDAGRLPVYRVRYCAAGIAYLHDWAATLPPPPTLWEQVEAEMLMRLEKERREEEYRRGRRWSGASHCPPSSPT
ncbi:hypothetical protein [Micromonospora sp. CPCC 206061]|uniref:hypothetical protein n=1 Tax=Micromonospora sp. CPCC 206061 TaxID=3122410 RepID=UPI002FF41AF5